MKKSNLRLFYPQKVKRHLFCALMACATVQYRQMLLLRPLLSR